MWDNQRSEGWEWPSFAICSEKLRRKRRLRAACRVFCANDIASVARRGPRIRTDKALVTAYLINRSAGKVSFSASSPGQRVKRVELGQQFYIIDNKQLRWCPEGDLNCRTPLKTNKLLKTMRATNARNCRYAVNLVRI